MPQPLNTTSIEIPVTFTCELEVWDMAEFDKAGKMRFGLTRANPRPHMPDIRREWEGDKVFCLRLMRNGEQIHRVMSDSIEDVTRLMSEGIVNIATGNFAQVSLQDFDREQFLAQNEDRNRLAVFLDANYWWEQERGEHKGFSGVIEVAIHYLRKERSRWLVRLRSRFRGGRDEKSMLGGAPEEWKE